MRKIVLNKEKLKDLYVHRKLSLAGCGEILGCTWWPVRVNLGDYGVRVRTTGEASKGIPKKNKINIDKEKLRQLYLKQKLGAMECGKILDCAPITIYRYLKDYKIPIRKNGWKFHKKVIINGGILRDLYLNQKLSIKQCAKRLNCSASPIRDYLRSEDILRTVGEALRGKKKPPRSKKYLANMSKARIGKPRFNIRGENHWNWKGGVTPLINQRIQKLEWKNLRKEIYRRDNWTCQVSGEHCDKNIQCHHIIPVGEDGTDISDNLTTLSKVSHNKIERSKFQSFWRYYLSKHIKISLN